jgi:hypothetical protein
MPALIRCPTCRRKLRVPDELLARNVECPDCRAVFVAEVESEDVEPAAPRARTAATRSSSTIEIETDDRRDEDDEDVPRRYRRRARRAQARDDVAGPAVGLVTVAAIDILLAFYFIFMSLVTAANGPEARGKLERGPAPNQGPVEPKADPEEEAERIVGSAVIVLWGVVCLLCGILTMIGGLLMKGLRGYSLALTCSALTVVPCTAPCCLAGVPIGIWSLVVLSRSEVRAAFD